MAAAAAFRANKFEEAESLYTEALEAAQQAFDRAAALSSRAQCRLKLKNFEGAREDAQAARALDPENPKAWYRLGVALSALGRLSEAQEALGEALQRRPEDADVQLALRAVLKRQSEGSEGRYDWLQVYQKYFETGPLAVAKSKGKVKEKSRCESECEVMAEDRLIATLDVEPYVGPVRVGYSPERGRGLFVTEDVAKGRLLLCARALVTGLNEDLPSQLVAAAETSAHLMEAVRSLSRGHPESEQKMPALSMAQLAKPEDLIDGDEPLDQLPLEEARNILYHNQFSLPLVNPNAAPLEVGNDTERSGLWLLPVFVNHSCLPNVQRIIVLDCLFLRAGRDLKEGEELFDGYVETLQPLWHRRESLEAYGFRCSCERCVLEEAIYPEGGARREELRKILEQAAGAVASRTEGAQLAEQMEAVATAADILMDRALAAALQEGVVPSTSIYQVPSVALSAQRMAMIRGGFERASDEEVFDFQRQDALQALLLGSVANVLRGYALSLRGLNRYVEAAGAWQRALDALDQVIPGSELGAIVANDMLSNKLLAFHLDHKQAAKKEMRSALLRSHWAYSGGAETWRHFSDKLFAPSVLDGGIAAWKTLQAEDPKLDTGGYQALPETVPAVPAKEKPGFEDLLRKRAAQRGKKSHEMRTPETTSDVAKPAQRTENQKSQGPSAGGGASCEVTTAVEDGVEQVTCVVNLPGLSSATEANLEVSESELRVTSLRADMPHVVCATLPLCVDPNSSRARWSKRHQQLTVRLENAERTMEELGMDQ